jgi:NitT/TauT family transport system permease protein
MSLIVRIENSRVLPPLVGFLVIAAGFVVLEWLIRLGLVNEFIVPLPSAVIAAVPRIIVHEQIGLRFLDTASKAVIAGFLVSVFGIGAGILLYKLRPLRRATETWVAAAAAAPTALMYPLFLVILGRGALTIVVMAFIAGLAPVILKTLEGLSATRTVLINVGRSFNFSGWHMFWKVLLPAALPSIFVGVRLGLIVALINIVAMEYLINVGGLGELINELAEQYDLAGTYASILFVILVSVAVFILTEGAERWLAKAT